MPYALIVVPEQASLDDATVAILEEYVRRGGIILSTGASIASEALQRLLGVRLRRRNVLTEGHIFRASGDPTGVYAGWDRLELSEAETLYPLYRSWDHDNPEIRMIPICYPINGMVDEESPEEAGFPGATIRRLGSGAAVHIPTDLFTVYWRIGYPDVLAWIKELLETLQPVPLFQTDAYSFVEIALRTKGDDLLVHFVNGNPGRDLSWVDTKDLWVDDIPAVGPITARIACAHRPCDARWFPGDLPANPTWADGVLEVALPRLDIHACLVVQGWERP